MTEVEDNEMFKSAVKKICWALSFVYPAKLISSWYIFISQIKTYYRLHKCDVYSENIYIDKTAETTGMEYWKLGDKVYIHKNCRIDAIKVKDIPPLLYLGNDVSIGDNTHIGVINRVYIGNNVLISAGCLIIDHSHGDNVSELDLPPTKRRLFSKGECCIEDNCWLGEGVSVLPGVTIGEGSVIGAYSVVSKDIPAYSLAVGNPAKVVKCMK